MPSVPGKGGGRRNEAAARNGKRVGPPPKYQALRVPIASGRSPIAVDNDALALLPGLLLRFPHVGTVEGVLALAIQRLAETTDE